MSTSYCFGRAFYCDSEGRLWDSAQKRQEFSTEDGKPITSVAKAQEVTVSQETPQEAVSETVEPEDVDPLKCHCGYVAKSKAGLAVHKLSHRVH